jgi:glycosyltransferase involved in cell wall biosynthesis
VSRPTISYIIPTVGRDSLHRAVASIERWEGDEVLVIQLDTPSGTYGNVERQIGVERATGDYLAFLDDDNYYVPGHRALQASAIAEAPDRPTLFRIQYPSGRVLWDRKRVKNGNVDSQMILVPNRKEMLSPWGARKKGGHRCGDFNFVNCWQWTWRVINWREDIICQMGREDVQYVKWLQKYGGEPNGGKLP